MKNDGYFLFYLFFMMSHASSVFMNSCLKLPVDPISKMPKSAHERKKSLVLEQSSIDSPSTVSSVSIDVDSEKLKDFYRSIPDYKDINHLPPEEFYSTLKSLREKKKVMFGHAIEHIDDCNGHDTENSIIFSKPSIFKSTFSNKNCVNSVKSKQNNSCAKQNVGKILYDKKSSNESNLFSNGKSTSRRPKKATTIDDTNKSIVAIPKNIEEKNIQRSEIRPENKDETDQKFDQFFHNIRSHPRPPSKTNTEFHTQSMPSSPLRTRRSVSPCRKVKNVTVPKPFKMTERDEEERMVNELRSIQKSFSADALNQKFERRQFKANPVPIESRIPLYDKILEDQAMRRAITKINSEAELQAQMKPFSFTKREEKGLGGMCERATFVLPKPKKKKKFRARPVPKNLFSNYFYGKMKQDQFFRSVNRHVRAEEMLRTASLPGAMAARERSRLSTPAAHSDLPTDPSPIIPSATPSDRQRAGSPTIGRKKRDKLPKDDFITTSPKPFRFNTADRAAKKMQDLTTKMYQGSKSSESFVGSGSIGPRAYSALDLRAAASGRSNLAALLRAESVRRKFEMESSERMMEQRRRAEMRYRDRLLRSKPAWQLVKNNHEADIAIRLQTRRDEERMRYEEFQHEMELMHDRVQRQPLLFERYYAPRNDPTPIDYFSPPLKKNSGKKRSLKKNNKYSFNSPNRSRKVSINDLTETYNGDVLEYLNRDGKLYSDSEIAIDSLDDGK